MSSKPINSGYLFKTRKLNHTCNFRFVPGFSEYLLTVVMGYKVKMFVLTIYLSHLIPIFARTFTTQNLPFFNIYKDN